MGIYMAYIGSLYRVITENEQARLRSSREDGNILAKAEGLHTDHPPRRPACTLARIMVSLSAFFAPADCWTWIEIKLGPRHDRIPPAPLASLSHQGWLDQMRDHGRRRICDLALEQLDAVS